MNEFSNNQYNSYYISSGPEPERINSFSVASMICGIISILLCCTGIFSIPVGALGILFAILTKRRGKAMPPMSLTGVILACVGIAMGLFMIAYSVFTILTDPEVRKAFEDSYEEYYQEFYNYGFEDLDYSSTDNTWYNDLIHGRSRPNGHPYHDAQQSWYNDLIHGRSRPNGHPYHDAQQSWSLID